MSSFSEFESAACERLRDLDSRLPPVTFSRFKLRLYKSLEQLSRTMKEGDPEMAVRDLIHIAARCRLFAEGLQGNESWRKTS